MFGFIREPGPRSPPTAIRRTLEADRLPLSVDRPSALAVVERRGRQQRRPVTYVRVFEPAWARALGVDVRAFDDLDAHPSLILMSGHIEPDGRPSGDLERPSGRVSDRRSSMATAFVELTRMEGETNGVSVLVNLGNVAWIESGANGTSRIVFAMVALNQREDAGPLSIVVRESAQGIAVLAGMVQKTDREAIAQAWVDQRGRRDDPDGGE